MWNFVRDFILYPLARFTFEFLGDHIWLAVLLGFLVLGAVIRWFLPWVIGFYRVFGWQGIALVLVGLLTLGAFGAGWRAHRASVLTGVDQSDPMFDLKKKAPLPKVRTKPRKKSAPDTELSVWDKMKQGIPLK